MATNDPEFYQAPKFTPEPYEPRRQRGCFFYGCIFASILAVLLLIAIVAMVFVVYRVAGRMVEEYTSTVPLQLPKVEMPEKERQALKERFEAFRKAVESGTPTGSLVLTSTDLNALLEESAEMKGKIYVTIEGDKLKGQVSIPLQSIGFPMLQGRYLNGEADLKASLKDGVLIVTLDSFEVNGKRPPEQVMESLRRENLAKDAYKEPKNTEMIRKLESMEIKDGKIIIKARAKPSGAREGQSAEKELPPDVVAPAESEKPKAGAAPEEQSKAKLPAPAGTP